MIKGGQYVKVNMDFIRPELSAAAVKVMVLFASIAQAADSDTIIISNSHIAERTGLTNVTRIINELYAVGAIKERIERYKDNRRRCNAFILSEALVKPAAYRFLPVSALELPKSSLRLLILYTLNANAQGRCLLSLAQIHELTSMARGTIVSCTKELQESGYIAKQRYQTYEGDYGHNRVYVTHIIRRSHSLRVAEVLRIMINGITANYSEKCNVEGVINADRSDALAALRKEICQLFRSTRVARFIRRIFMRVRRSLSCGFFYQYERGRKMKKRLIYSLPVLLI